MKKRVLAAVMMLALLIAAAALVIVADDTYTGNVAEANGLIARFDTANTVANKMKALDSAVAYMATVDPDAEGYADMVARYKSKSLALATLCLDNAKRASDPVVKNEALDVLFDAVTAHPVSDCEGYAEFAAEYEEQKLLALDGYLELCRAAGSADDKHAVIDAVAALVAKHEPTLREGYADALDAEIFLAAKLYLEAFDGEKGTAHNGTAARKLLNFINDHHVSEELEGYAEFVASMDENLAEYRLAFDAAALKATALSTPSQFAEPIVFDLKFDGDRDVGSLIPDNNVVNGEVVSEIGKDKGADGENGYYTIKFDYANRHLRTDAKLTKVDFPYVFECDVTTFDHLPNGTIHFEDYGTENGLTWNVVLFSITASGHMSRGGNIIAENVVIPGQWTHISVASDVKNAKLYIYIDYELVATASAENAANGYTSYVPSVVRIGGNASTPGGSISIDNVRIYAGNSPIAIDALAEMDDAERFIFYTEKLSNPDCDAFVKQNYHSEIGKFIHLFWNGEDYLTENEELRSAVDAYLAVDRTEIDLMVKQANLDKLNTMYLKLKGYTRGEANFSKRAYLLGKIDSFNGSILGAISTGELYDEIVAYISNVREELSKEERAVEFIGYVNDFYAAASVEKRTESCRLALEMLPTLDLGLLNDAVSYPTFVDALDRSTRMEEILEENICIENSKLLLACISFVMNYCTADEWDENYEALAPFVATAREIIEGGNYDVYYNDLGSAIESFEPMNEYFYTKLWENHVAFVSSELERCRTSEVFFEKYGICVKVKEYVRENGIDPETEPFAGYLAEVETILAELMANEDEYEAMLEENTGRFIEICKGLVGSIDYATMKSICTEASAYFYTMNVSNALAQDAIQIYTTRRDEVRAAENIANEFVESVLRLTVFEGNPLKLIIECAAYLDDVDITIPGVEAAVDMLTAECEEYDAQYAEINAEIAVTHTAVASVSNTSGMGSFITKILAALAEK